MGRSNGPRFDEVLVLIDTQQIGGRSIGFRGKPGQRRVALSLHRKPTVIPTIRNPDGPPQMPNALW